MREMLPIIMNTSFMKLGIVDDYTSFIWTIRYYLTGDFELYAPLNEKNLSLFQRDYYVMRDNDENVGIIESVVFTRDEDAREIIGIKGRFLSCILGRRIIATQTQVSGAIGSCVERLVNENAINPTMSVRQIPNLVFHSDSHTGKTMDAQFTGESLLTTIEDICKTYLIGFKMILTDDKKFSFQLYDGVDRSYNQSAVPFVVFSEKYDNLASFELNENYQTLITDILSAGEGEGISRKTIWVARQSKSGLQRYEGYDDNRHISSNDGQISETVYYQQLREAGYEKLSGIVVAVGGKIYSESVEYGKDVNVGDICVVENSRWNISVNSRLIEVIESVNEAGEYSILPTFGDQESEG